MYDTRNLGLADAQRAAGAILAELGRLGKPAAMAVADAHGEVVLLLRMDRTPLACMNNAANKAFTAARERKTSREVGKASRDPVTGFDLANFGDRRYIGWGGGVPVVVNGQAVGAVAVSGLDEQADEDLALLGVGAILQG